MAPLELTQSALAKALAVPALRISQIVRGQRAITADTALRLSRDFVTGRVPSGRWTHPATSNQLASSTRTEWKRL